MRDREELQWLRDRGVRIDHKGRIIVSLPVLDEYQFSSEELEPSIAELMRRDVRTHGGSRGRRRKSAAKPTPSRTVSRVDVASSSRIGRPAIGAEVRVYVQTSIARVTREILGQRGVTLAEVFDDFARELAHGT
jgi:hypothetical protein